MKKTITLPDGTVEVLEGTPQEIAEHEKLIRERAGQIKEKKKPEVIKGKDAEHPSIIDLLKKLGSAPPRQPPFLPISPDLVGPPFCYNCSSSPCMCRHVWGPQAHHTIA